MSGAKPSLNGGGGIGRDNDDDEDDGILTSMAPSHITPDGVFVHLPPPGPRERRAYFERSIARHKLLQEDLKGPSKPQARHGGGEADDGEEVDEDGSVDDPTPLKKRDEAKKKKDDDAAAIKVHPLAMASAKIQASGLSELNRAINLSGLVSSGEYFGMANVVDPSLVAAETISGGTATASTSNAAAAGSSSSLATGSKENSAAAQSAAAGSGAAASAGPSGQDGDDEQQRVKSLYVLKRKRSQFAKSAHSLQLHRDRLRAGIVAQSRPDSRLRQLRRHWRLVAPEHGTRALPHPARPTEALAVDVDMYYSAATTGTGASSNTGENDQAFGRLTSRVPRYATLELMEGYKYQSDLERWEQQFQQPEHRIVDDDDNDNDAMDVDVDEQGENVAGKEYGEVEEHIWTVAEPFAIADPTLGKVDVDFDPTKAKTMLSLQFDIEKASTGFRQSAVLRSIVSSSYAASTIHPDESVLFELQHSLFAAKLFESIRREIAPDTDEIGTIRPGGTAAAGSNTNNPHSSAWISQESNMNFLPPPTLMSGTGSGDGLVPLCVVHCHEGEVKVQLDCEYTLRVKLVEANDHPSRSAVDKPPTEATSPTAESETPECDGSASSGSQTPEQLLLLCRTLLYHAEERYHNHSKGIALEAAAAAAASTAAAASHVKSTAYVHDAHARKPSVRSPHILQSCVSLGAKLLMEDRVRVALRDVQQWLLRRQKLAHNGSSTNGTHSAGEALHVTWLSLSAFDMHSQFTMSFRHWVADAVLVGEEITVTSTTPIAGAGGGIATTEYRKVKFHSDEQLVVHLKLILQRMLRTKS